MSELSKAFEGVSFDMDDEDENPKPTMRRVEIHVQKCASIVHYEDGAAMIVADVAEHDVRELQMFAEGTWFHNGFLSNNASVSFDFGPPDGVPARNYNSPKE